MKIWHVKKEVGYGGSLFYQLVNNANNLPEPLPWIDPSINCLYQEAVLSYLVGNYQSALSDLCMLMEHVPRAALLNSEHSGMARKDSKKQLDKYRSLKIVIEEAEKVGLMNGCDVDWWKAVTKAIRNKAAHYILPVLLKKCAEEGPLKKYINKYELPENNYPDWYETHLINWGSFYHGAGEDFVTKFIVDVTKELKIVISNTKWNGDESWWISLKNAYDSFFQYDWTLEKLKYSIENGCTVIDEKFIDKTDEKEV